MEGAPGREVGATAAPFTLKPAYGTSRTVGATCGERWFLLYAGVPAGAIERR